MKLMALMLARNEDWVIGASARAALKWCDDLIVLDHASTDGTIDTILKVADEHPGRVYIEREDDGSRWDEMAHRQRTLDLGRRLGGTHFAIVDADEILTAPLLSSIRTWIVHLSPGNALELPLLACWRSLDQYRDDLSIWSHAWVALAFADGPGVGWRTDASGYQLHHRLPYGTSRGATHLARHSAGGVMHLQFTNWRRLVAKHALYKMTEVIRWPERRTVAEVDRDYSRALEQGGIKLATCPPEWWEGYARDAIKLDGIPWQEAECRRLWAIHGPERFEGLELWGVVG
jgi:glycosyl transferase family 2